MVNSEPANWSICWHKVASALTICITCFLINEKLIILNTVGPICLRSALQLFWSSSLFAVSFSPSQLLLINFFKLKTWTSIIGHNNQLHYVLSINCGFSLTTLLSPHYYYHGLFQNFIAFVTGNLGLSGFLFVCLFFSLNLFVAFIHLLFCTFLPVFIPAEIMNMIIFVLAFVLPH